MNAGAPSVVTLGRLIRFSHTVFSVPFALVSAAVALDGGLPTARTTVLVLVCLVAARTAAMGYNRLADRHLDARNPRTAGREIPPGAP